MKSSVRQLPNLWEIVVHTIEFMPTSVGEARVAWYPALGKSRAIPTVGHGTATGIETPDLQALAKTLPARGITVGLVEQPYRVVGDPSLSGPTILDTVWRELWPRFESARLPVIAGRRGKFGPSWSYPPGRVQLARLAVIRWRPSSDREVRTMPISTSLTPLRCSRVK
jgi:hypothetical protein